MIYPRVAGFTLALVRFALAIKLDDHGWSDGHDDGFFCVRAKVMSGFFLPLSLALARERAQEKASWETADRPMGKSVTKITVPCMYPAPKQVLLLKLESLRYALSAHESSVFLRVKPVLGSGRYKTLGRLASVSHDG